MEWQIGVKTLSFMAIGLGLVGISAVFALKSYAGRYNGNVRVLHPDHVYRSGQLTGTQLLEVLTSKHIRSVLNLRGALPEDIPLRNEREVCRQSGIVHADIEMQPDHLPTPEQATRLLQLLEVLPRPLLIHCGAGSDRTGLASTLYLHLHQNQSLEQAQASQLTWRYGHWPVGKNRAMDDFLDLYRQTGPQLTLSEWVQTRYPQLYAKLEQKDQQTAPKTEVITRSG